MNSLKNTENRVSKINIVYNRAIVVQDLNDTSVAQKVADAIQVYFDKVRAKDPNAVVNLFLHTKPSIKIDKKRGKKHFIPYVKFTVEAYYDFENGCEQFTYTNNLFLSKELSKTIDADITKLLEYGKGVSKMVNFYSEFSRIAERRMCENDWVKPNQE